MRLNKCLDGFVCSVFLLSFCSPVLADGPAPQSPQPLSYGPAKVELIGTLLVKQEYGPPNFGENPDTDQKVQIYVLHLSVPVDIKADSNPESNDPDTDNYSGVRDIQVFFLESAPKTDVIKTFINKKIRVSGSLFEKTSPGDYMDVIMEVDAVKPAG